MGCRPPDGERRPADPSPNSSAVARPELRGERLSFTAVYHAVITDTGKAIIAVHAATRNRKPAKAVMAFPSWSASHDGSDKGRKAIGKANISSSQRQTDSKAPMPRS